MRGEVRVLPDRAALAEEAAAQIAAILRTSRGPTIALAGGDTPRQAYERLATHDVPWERVRVCWGDERWVAPDDPASNQRMAREALLARVPIAASRVHPMPAGAGDPAAAAAAYEATLRGIFPGPWPRFDVVLLGVGADGHTASLFPGSPALDVTGRWVAATIAPDGRPRLSLTLSAINRSRAVLVLAAGREKADAVRRAVEGDPSIPAGRIAPVDGRLVWLLDREAASGVA